MKLYLLPTAILSLACAIIFVSDGLGSLTEAQVRTSSNYQLQSDSVNVGGGLSSSTNFAQESTIGEIATGQSTSSNFSLQAGYQQMQVVFLSLSGGSDVLMSPSLPGITGGQSNGSTTFTVVTDSPAGYQLTIQSVGDPAMQRADGISISDYTPTGAADFTFAVPSASAEFAYTPEGADIATVFLDNGATCGVGSSDTSLSCWAGLSTTAQEISRSSSSNHPVGATTTVRFRVGVMSGAGVESGVYTATTTVTALPL